MKYSPPNTSNNKITNRKKYVEPYNYNPKINQKSICMSRTV